MEALKSTPALQVLSSSPRRFGELSALASTSGRRRGHGVVSFSSSAVFGVRPFRKPVTLKLAAWGTRKAWRRQGKQQRAGRVSTAVAVAAAAVADEPVATAGANAPGTLYSVLGVEAGADLSAVKSAHRLMARRYHPDDVVECTRKFLEVQHAYEILFRRTEAGRSMTTL